MDGPYAVGVMAFEMLLGRVPFDDPDEPWAVLIRHINDDPPPLAGIRRRTCRPVSSRGSTQCSAKEPTARPAGAAHAWDRLEGVVSDALGPRWRRAALLTESADEPAAEAEPGAPSERSGIFSVVLPPVPAPVQTSSAPAVPGAAPGDPSTPRRCSRNRRTRRQWEPALGGGVEPAAPVPAHIVVRAGARAGAHPPRAGLPDEARAAALRAPEEPRACPPPARSRAPSSSRSPARCSSRSRRSCTRRRPERSRVRLRGRPGRRWRSGFARRSPPRWRATRSCRRELSSLVPGAKPGDARDRASAAIPATNVARTALSELPATAADERLLRARAQRALHAQSDYLEIVVLALALQADDAQLDRLGPVSARLVSRLERIETAVPRASETVGGARRLKAWVDADGDLRLELGVGGELERPGLPGLHPPLARARGDGRERMPR